jgi:serine/threonine protein kinase
MGNAAAGVIKAWSPYQFEDKYTLGQQLGKGSQGRVHVCVEKETQKRRAVKIIERTSKSWNAYTREVELCDDCHKATSSSNVIRVIEEFVGTTHCFVVMEKFEGHLRKGLKWVATEMNQAVAELGDMALKNLVRQVSSAIAHIHCCGVVHRDVKAQNVFVDRLDLRDTRCRVVLGDLGLARRLDRGRFLSAQVGTRKYWAPEMYDKRYWHAVDVFALGVTFFLVCSYSYPYIDEMETRNRDIVAEGVVPSSLDPRAFDLLTKTLSKDPKGRPDSTQLATHPWFVDDQPCNHSGENQVFTPRRGPRASMARAPVIQLDGAQSDVWDEEDAADVTAEQTDVLLMDEDVDFEMHDSASPEEIRSRPFYEVDLDTGCMVSGRGVAFVPASTPRFSGPRIDAPEEICYRL